MPQAPAVLRQDSSANEKKKALLELEHRLESKGVSAVKAQVLRAVVNFAKHNLVQAGPLDYSPALYTACNAIFNQAHLADLPFLHAVIGCLNALQNDTSGLKKAVLPMAENYKRPLMSKASFGLFHRSTLASETIRAVLPVPRNRFQPGT